MECISTVGSVGSRKRTFLATGCAHSRKSAPALPPSEACPLGKLWFSWIYVSPYTMPSSDLILSRILLDCLLTSFSQHYKSHPSFGAQPTLSVKHSIVGNTHIGLFILALMHTYVFAVFHYYKWLVYTLPLYDELCFSPGYRWRNGTARTQGVCVTLSCKWWWRHSFQTAQTTVSVAPQPQEQLVYLLPIWWMCNDSSH